MILPTIVVEKPWGTTPLPERFRRWDNGRRIGEIWFESPLQCQELLIKYICTSEKLSVQVHPSNEQTMRKSMGRRGKEECWLILDAAPSATVGVGLTGTVDAEGLREAAKDGTIEKLLSWHPVKPGDFIYIPANTIHAIGANISLIEVQQNSDITYRLYDYGRPRELHLEEGMEIARRGPHPARYRRHIATTGSHRLVEGPHFRLSVIGDQPGDALRLFEGPCFVAVLEGRATVDGATVGPSLCAMAESPDGIAMDGHARALVAQPVQQKHSL